MRREILAGMAVLTLWLGSLPVSAATSFEVGNTAFKAGKFEEAEVAYKRELAEGGDTSALRFNLGKVREAQGDPGGAMLEWERALRISAEHGPSRAALATARLTNGARIAPEHWWASLKPELARGVEGWIAAIGAWMLVGALLGAWILRWRMGAGFLGACGAFLLSLGLLWWRDAAWEVDVALVRERSVTVRSAPADPARSLVELQAGSRVRILGESAGWNRCALPDGAIGWVPANTIERIEAKR